MGQPSTSSFAFASTPSEPSLAVSEQRPRAVTWRSFLIGTLLCGLLCMIMPYNDYVVENTIIIGSYLPLFLVLAFFILVVVINAPLHAWAPQKALSRGELAVIMAMLLVACSIPAQGLMRTLVPNMITPHYFGQSQHDPKFYKAFLGMDIPPWMREWMYATQNPDDAVIKDFYGRVQPGQPMPFGAWVKPMVGWGVFLFGLMATLVSMAIIIGPQWSTNERLAFPIAQLQQALIEPPEKGRALNEMFRSRLFWIALGFVLLLHLFIGGNKYLPAYIPKYELKFNLTAVFTEEPWVHFNGQTKMQTIFFTFIGITYFIPARLSFSLWALYLIMEVINVVFKSHQAGIEQPAWEDQQLGASVAFLMGVFWIGRAQWAMAVRHLVGKVRSSDAGNYRWPMVFLLIGLTVMVGWLVTGGVQLWMAVMIVAVVLVAHLVVARVVAETGMPCLRSYANPMQVISNMPPGILKGSDVYFGGLFYSQGCLTTRESLLTFATHGLRAASDNNTARVGRGVIAMMVWALLFSFIVSGASWLWTYYSYSVPLTPRNAATINNLSLIDWPKTQYVDQVMQWSDKRFPNKAHSPATHVSIGFVVTGLLQLATLRWAAWPFTPIGFLMSNNPYIRQTWFSIFLGWLAKTLIVKYGGAKMFQQARPVFYGMVFGEALAALVWMVINFYLAAMGYEYQSMQLLPI